MRKTVLLSALALFAVVALASCSKQNDCSCTYSASKKTVHQKAAAGSSTQIVYDWGSDCSDITASDINLGSNYSVNCSEM